MPPEEDEDRGKAALTELFNEIKTTDTPVVVERVVADIDEIVRLVRFPGWQGTQAGEREVKKALRKALFKYKLHADEELFEPLTDRRRRQVQAACRSFEAAFAEHGGESRQLGVVDLHG